MRKAGFSSRSVSNPGIPIIFGLKIPFFRCHNSNNRIVGGTYSGNVDSNILLGSLSKPTFGSSVIRVGLFEATNKCIMEPNQVLVGG